jgi:cytochrome c-type biogenesis protein CcmH/NrfG
MNAWRSVSNLSCPSEALWAKLAAGLIQDRHADGLLIHASECKFCSGTLREFLFVLGLAGNSSETSTDFPVTERNSIYGLARLMSAAVSKPSPRVVTPRQKFLGVLAGDITPRAWWVRAGLIAAALAVLLAVVPCRLLRERQAPPLAFLAQAYSARRTFELRIPGAPYARMSDRRSARPDELPPELLESLAKIQRRLAQRPADPNWLHAFGRAQLLTGQADAALQSFQAARSEPDSPEFWIDFATAHFARAEAMGDTSEYTKAARFLDRALLVEPRDPVALFNRAIVNLRLSRNEAAIRDAQLCLEIETDGGWRQETQRLLQELRRRRRGG